MYNVVKYKKLLKMNFSYFTLFTVSCIYRLFTEQLTRNTESNRKDCFGTNIHKKNENRRRKIAEYQFSMVVSSGINSSHFAIMSC